MNINRNDCSALASNFGKMSLCNRTAYSQDTNVCQRCSILCQNPDVWTLRWKFLFNYEARPDDLTAVQCKICLFFKEVVAEHKRLSAEKLPPPSVSIRSTPSAQNACLLRIAYKLPRRYQVYSVRLTHQGSTDECFSSWAHGQGIAFDKIKQWITECEGHDHYELAMDHSITGLRVIRCDSDVATVIDAPQFCDFVALSYVWGESTESSFTTGDVLPDNLPQTIKDSIVVTRSLGFKYLWIDRYCINQHDNSDKSHQISQMGAIYAHAKVTICAVMGSDPSYGLPGVGVGRRMPYTDATIGKIHLRHEWDCSEGIRRSVWVSRGWTLQESYLSKRRLLFTDRQVVFACNAIAHHEFTLERQNPGSPGGMIGPSFDESIAEENALLELMKTYSRRQLRYHEDAFNAVSGMLECLTGPGTGRAHLWGVPVYSRLVSKTEADDQLLLLWQSNSPGIRRGGFPSWSQIGWTSSIGFDSASVYGIGTFEVQIRVDNCWTAWEILSLSQIETLMTTCTPQSHSRFLRISAVTFRSRLRWDDSSKSCMVSLSDDYVAKPHWDGDPSELGLEKTVVCAAIAGLRVNFRSIILLLKPSLHVPPSQLLDENPALPVYERVGTINPQIMRPKAGDDWREHMKDRLDEIEKRTETFLLA